jgi:hypothetical protein
MSGRLESPVIFDEGMVQSVVPRLQRMPPLRLRRRFPEPVDHVRVSHQCVGQEFPRGHWFGILLLELFARRSVQISVATVMSFERQAFALAQGDVVFEHELEVRSRSAIVEPGIDNLAR